MRRALDWTHGERGRLIYDCEPSALMAGMCKDLDDVSEDDIKH